MNDPNEREKLLVNWSSSLKGGFALLKSARKKKRKSLKKPSLAGAKAHARRASAQPPQATNPAYPFTAAQPVHRRPEPGPAAPQTSSVIRTISPTPFWNNGRIARLGALRRSHVHASLVMAVFVGGSGALSILPELPNAPKWVLPHNTARIALGPPPGSIVTASMSPNPESLLDVLKPRVADDLTQAQALPETRTLTVRSGDTLSELLTEAGASADDARAAVAALRARFDPRRIRVGQDIELTLGPIPQLDSGEDEAEGRPLLGFSVQTDLTTHVSVSRAENGQFTADVTLAKLIEKPILASAQIDSSLFIAAEDVGIPDSVIVDFIRLYSYDVDFQREIQKGDRFEVYYTRLETEKGAVVQNGRILYAALTANGKTHKLWRYEAKNDSIADYYDETGRSAKKFLMRTPVDGAHLTSGYGMRMHPLLGYTKMHKGVDFGAPIGTPVMAAGSGVVEYAAPYGSYGNYVRIRHSNGYKTAYAHLRGFARGIKVGAHVTQGQTIAYVGMTGRSTGPHLHYEVLVSDHQVNPMGIRVATGLQLEGQELAAFKQMRAGLTAEMAAAQQVGSPIPPTATLASGVPTLAR